MKDFLLSSIWAVYAFAFLALGLGLFQTLLECRQKTNSWKECFHRMWLEMVLVMAEIEINKGGKSYESDGSDITGDDLG